MIFNTLRNKVTSKEAIFIFTKDRPGTLSKTLDSIRTVPFNKYVIDNSTTSKNQQSVEKQCASFTNCIYLGKKGFNEFTSKHRIKFPKFSFLLKEVGNREWNLGFARNLALLYSKSLCLDKVLFSDDDIHVPNTNLIDDLFEKINDYQFVGANISGLVDDSVVGHIATNIGIMNERMLSGGFMVFNPIKIDHYFLNIYNEDWIWLFLQLQGKKYLQTGEVFQELIDPLKNYKDKIAFQEFGEIVLDGILDLFNSTSYDSLTQLSFWQRLIQEREEYLNRLVTAALKVNNQNHIEIIEWIKANSENINAELFCKLFQDYYSNRVAFLKLYASL